MDSRKLETATERATVKALIKLGWTCIKLTGSMGIPDRLCIGPRKQMFFVEFKAPGNTQSDHQIAWEEHLTSLGFKVLLAYHRNIVLNYVRRISIP